MFNELKKLLLGLCISAVVFIGFKASAAESSTTITTSAAVTNGIATNAWFISKIVVTTPSGNSANLTLNFYDNGQTNIIYTNAAYTNFTTITTNYTALYTNTLGIIQTNRYVGTWQLANEVAAATNTLPVIAAFSLTPGSTETRSGLQISTVKGLTATANTNCTIIITYSDVY